MNATLEQTATDTAHNASAWTCAIDWNHAREHLLRCVKARAMSLDPATVEDLAHEALIRAHRTLGRGEVLRSWEAFLADVAKKTVIDHVRSRQRWSLVLQEEGEHPIGDRPGEDLSRVAYAGDPIERLRFLLSELFRLHAPDLLDVLEDRLNGRDWNDIADARGITPAALRQRWKRALDALRSLDRSAEGIGALIDWMETAEG